jgi:hypothetical protein
LGISNRCLFQDSLARRNITDLAGLSLRGLGILRRTTFVPVRLVVQLGSIDFSADGTVPSRIYVKRILKSAVFVLATLYFIVDAVFLTIATPLARWMARQRIFIRLRKWIGSLRPYPSLALFAVPLIVLEPVKPVAALFNRYRPNRGGNNDAGCRRITKTGNRRAFIQTLPSQAPENPDFCLGLRTLAAGR